MDVHQTDHQDGLAIKGEIPSNTGETEGNGWSNNERSSQPHLEL